MCCVFCNANAINVCEPPLGPTSCSFGESGLFRLPKLLTTLLATSHQSPRLVFDGATTGDNKHDHDQKPQTANMSFEPKTKVELDPPKDDIISVDYLSKCDGMLNFI